MLPAPLFEKRIVNGALPTVDDSSEMVRLYNKVQRPVRL